MSARVVHFEIPHDDAERATSFYREAFGWDVQSLPEMGYTIVATGPAGDQGPSEPGYINGGMLQRSELSRAPVLTIAVEDIDAALATVESHGGTTLRGRLPVGEMGFAAYFTDTEGNVMGLWENAP
jgi:predicted enzyme related to lactoylglutathione lyase